uniref:Amyloid protein-binding protein 2 n=1 Tax=Pan troglodytes TaxID=9598 RepID=G2HEN7_PANTR|nr:amyloid protein-binding protein 2 [Pan troglodytes]
MKIWLTLLMSTSIALGNLTMHYFMQKELLVSLPTSYLKIIFFWLLQRG